MALQLLQGASMLGQVAKSWFAKLMDPSTPLLPFIPKSIKLLFLLLVLLNSPSFPFLWHLRVWYYPLHAYFQVWTKGRSKYLKDWVVQSQKLGGIELKTSIQRTNWFDDSDYNLHMSNSCVLSDRYGKSLISRCYAKNVDASRMKWCIVAMAPLFTPNVHMALGASHYVFLKEIRTGATYTIETRIGGWGDKWMFLVSEFIIYPKNKSGKTSGKPSTVEAVKGTVDTVIPPISAAPSGTATPAESGDVSTLESVKKAANLRVREPRADGGVVCTLVVTEYCVKAGRITVPPRIALFFSMISKSPEQRERARKIMLGSKDFGYKWLRGGWKEEPDAATLGMDLGHEVDQEATSVAQWVTEGNAGMEKVSEGLAVF